MVFGFGQKNIGIDLGTSNTYIYAEGRGILLKEPSYIARNKKTNEVIAVGSAAKMMMGKTPSNIEVIRPLKNGVIDNLEMTIEMLRLFLKQAFNNRVGNPVVTIGVPSGVTSVERRAVVEAVRSAGAREAYVIVEPFAAAVGSGLPVMDSIGSMVVDIGGGTTDVIAISLGGIIAERSINIAGDVFNASIANYAREHFGLVIGETTAERLKMEIGTADLQAVNGLPLSVASGRSLNNGTPMTVEFSSEDIANALQEPISQIIRIIIETLDATPAELRADIIDRGIVITGGGALLRNINDVITKATNIPAFVNEDTAAEAVAIGTGEALKSIDLFNGTAENN